MTEEDIVEELRTIRTLLAIDKKQELAELTEDLSDLQIHILEQLSYTEWQPLNSSEIADSFGCGSTKVGNHRSELVERNLVSKEGAKRGATYRKTGLLRAAEQIGVIEVSND